MVFGLQILLLKCVIFFAHLVPYDWLVRCQVDGTGSLIITSSYHATTQYYIQLIKCNIGEPTSTCSTKLWQCVWWRYTHQTCSIHLIWILCYETAVHSPFGITVIVIIGVCVVAAIAGMAFFIKRRIDKKKQHKSSDDYYKLLDTVGPASEDWWIDKKSVEMQQKHTKFTWVFLSCTSNIAKIDLFPLYQINFCLASFNKLVVQVQERSQSPHHLCCVPHYCTHVRYDRGQQTRHITDRELRIGTMWSGKLARWDVGGSDFAYRRT